MITTLLGCLLICCAVSIACVHGRWMPVGAENQAKVCDTLTGICLSIRLAHCGGLCQQGAAKCAG